MTSPNYNSFIDTLRRGPLRFISDARSGGVIVERTSDTHALSLQAVRSISRLSRSAAPGVVLMLDIRDQLASSDSVDRLVASEPSRFASVHALCFTSGIKALATTATRHREIGRGFWELTLTNDEAAPGQPEVGEELQVLMRWIDGSRTRQLNAGIRASIAAVRPIGSAIPAHASDIERRVQLRDRLRKDVPLVIAEQWAALAGNNGRNPSAALGKYKSAGRLFAVTHGNRDLYPAFQFSEKDSKPKDSIARVLQRVPASARGWPLLSWFNAPNVLLGNQKPTDVLDKNPAAVADAADRFYGRDD